MKKIVVVAFATLALFGCSRTEDSTAVELLNVSYDPTRELWRDINSRFVPKYEQETGVRLTINQSHGGSGTQARAVIDGLEADVVTLAMWADVDAIRKAGLINPGWEERLPNRSLPYSSTIVFVVRKGNPKGLRDWPDLVKPGVEVITPNPKTSANGRLSFLAAFGSVLHKGGTETQAREYVTQLYRHVPVLDSGARGATATFSQKHLGDVHITWENEAHLENAEANGELEIVYPSCSIRAEPYVAVVDANARNRGTERVASAYLKFLYGGEGQEIIARHYYRPIDPEVLRKHSATLAPIEMFQVTTVAKSWDEAQQKFFAQGGIFDAIYRPGAAGQP